MKAYKQRLALAIMHHIGAEELTEEQKTNMLDLEAEYDLIQNKKSKLSRARRDEIEYVWKSIQESEDDSRISKETQTDS
jgi:hypothetical protein